MSNIDFVIAHHGVKGQKWGVTKKVLKESSKLMDESAKVIPNKKGQQVKKDYSKIPNDELERRIRRLELEDRYGRLSGDTKYVKSGSEKAKELLHTMGSVLAAAATAVGIAALIQQMKMNSAENQINKNNKSNKSKNSKK